MQKNTDDIVLHVAFDFDGVLIDSLTSMNVSWKKTMKKLNLEYKFKEYKKYLGYPFFDVLFYLKIPKKHHSKIYYIYKKNSLKNIKYIKKYKNVSSSLKILNEKKIKISLVTSKSKITTNKIIHILFNNNFFDSIITLDDVIKGKPNADSIIKSCKNVNISPNNTIYVGDMNVDYETAKNANVRFIFAKWGYGSLNNYKLQFSNIKDLTKYIIN